MAQADQPQTPGLSEASTFKNSQYCQQCGREIVAKLNHNVRYDSANRSNICIVLRSRRGLCKAAFAVAFLCGCIRGTTALALLQCTCKASSLASLQRSPASDVSHAHICHSTRLTQSCDNQIVQHCRRRPVRLHSRGLIGFTEGSTWTFALTTRLRDALYRNHGPSAGSYAGPQHRQRSGGMPSLGAWSTLIGFGLMTLAAQTVVSGVYAFGEL